MLDRNFIQRNRELQKRVRAELSNLKDDNGFKSEGTLQAILNQLEAIEKKDCVILSYTRYIIDSGNYADELGTDLIEHAALYKKLQEKRSK